MFSGLGEQERTDTLLLSEDTKYLLIAFFRVIF
jgi:hypothetical protein